MTSSDYILDLALVAVVLLQMRGRRVSLRSLLIPVAIVADVCHQYLHGVPTGGDNLLLVVVASATGVTLGTLAGLLTSVRPDAAGAPVAKAGLAAAALWVFGVGCRFAFQFYASHGGAPAIGRFSQAHHITSSEAWVAALILMALGEALSRTAVIGARSVRIAPHHFLPRRAMIGAGARA